MKACYWVPLQGYKMVGKDPNLVVDAARTVSARTAHGVLESKFNRTLAHYIGDFETVLFLLERQFDHRIWTFPTGYAIMEVLLEDIDLVEYKLRFAEPKYARLRVAGDKGPHLIVSEMAT